MKISPRSIFLAMTVVFPMVLLVIACRTGKQQPEATTIFDVSYMNPDTVFYITDEQFRLLTEELDAISFLAEKNKVLNTDTIALIRAYIQMRMSYNSALSDNTYALDFDEGGVNAPGLRFLVPAAVFIDRDGNPIPFDSVQINFEDLKNYFASSRRGFWGGLRFYPALYGNTIRTIISTCQADSEMRKY